MNNARPIFDDARGTGLVSTVVGIDPRVGQDEPLIGEWWIDTSRCYYDRLLPVPPDPEGWTPLNRGGVRPASGAGGIGVGKWTYALEGRGVRTLYHQGNGPDSPAEPIMQYFATWDGTPWADPHAPLLTGQLAQVWRLDPRFVVRLVLDNTKPELPRWEWAVWATATDGHRFACTSWDAAVPDRHNLQVFDKRLGPTYDSQGAGAPIALPDAADPIVIAEDPLFGTWVLDDARSSFLRHGQDGDGQPGPYVQQTRQISARSAIARWDGVERHDADDSLTSWRIADEVAVSRTRASGPTTTWSLYSLSTDRATLVVTSWDEARPDERDIEVYARPTGDAAASV
jgi:hypothetical protein